MSRVEDIFSRKSQSIRYWMVVCLFLPLGCAGPVKKKENRLDRSPEAETSKASSDDSSTNLASLLSIEEAFIKHVHPKLKSDPWCGQCHTADTEPPELPASPFFASADAAEAWKEIEQSFKINILLPERSRIYLQLKENNHNCPSGDCENAAAALLADLKAMKQAIDPEKLKALVEDSEKNNTASLKFDQGEVDPSTYASEIEDGQLANGSAFALVAGMGSGAGHLLAAASANRADNPGVVLSVNILEAGTYRVFGLVGSPNANNNRFGVVVNGGAEAVWQYDNTDNNWTWQRAKDGQGNPMEFNLDEGANTIEIRPRGNGVKIDLLAVTSDPDFSAAAPGGVRILKFDVSEWLGEGAKFETTMTPIAEDGYLLSKPKLTGITKAAKIRGIKVKVNDSWDPNSSSWLVVDGSFNADQIIDSPMVIGADKGIDQDEISLQFDLIE